MDSGAGEEDGQLLGHHGEAAQGHALVMDGPYLGWQCQGLFWTLCPAMAPRERVEAMQPSVQ